MLKHVQKNDILGIEERKLECRRVYPEVSERLGFNSRRGLGIFLFITGSRTALGPTQPPIQWVLGVPSLGVKRPGREADHSPPSITEVKE
jgi:hypothetical protein